MPVALGVSHCGGGCTLGDIIAETVIFLAGWTLVGAALYAEMLGDFVLALALGIGFQYFAIAPMRGLGLRQGLAQAAKADALSLVAFEVGLFAWMFLMAFVFFPEPHRLHPDSAVYWFLMQIGMVIGFFTAWPANVWLIRRGIKEAMWRVQAARPRRRSRAGGPGPLHVSGSARPSRRGGWSPERDVRQLLRVHLHVQGCDPPLGRDIERHHSDHAAASGEDQSQLAVHDPDVDRDARRELA